MSSPLQGDGGMPATSCSQQTTLRRIVWSALMLTMPKAGGSGIGLKAKAEPVATTRLTAAAAAIVRTCIEVSSTDRKAWPPAGGRPRSNDHGPALESKDAIRRQNRSRADARAASPEGIPFG